MMKLMINTPQITQEYSNKNGILKGHGGLTSICCFFVLYEAVYSAHHDFTFFKIFRCLKTFFINIFKNSGKNPNMLTDG